MLITIVSFVCMLIVVILAHELGHFITAKLTKVRVDEFGLGFPPRIFGIKRGETTYSLNYIPIGGFVKMAGEEDPNIMRSLAGKSKPVRLLVLGAGSLMNLLLPLLLLSIAFMIPHNVVVGRVTVEDVASNSPAAMAGIEPGDVFLSINEKPVHNVTDISGYFYLNLGKEVTALIEHSDGTTEEVKLTPRWKPPEGQGAAGVAIITRDATIVRQRYPFWRAVPLGFNRCVEIMLLFKNGIVSVVTGATPLLLTGPVGIAQMTGEVAKAGIVALSSPSLFGE